MPGDEETLFAIHDDESRCKLAIECKVAQLPVEKGIAVSRLVKMVQSTLNILNKSDLNQMWRELWSKHKRVYVLMS